MDEINRIKGTADIMRINETLKKPMLEAKYLNVDNTDRYRPIIRLFI